MLEMAAALKERGDDITVLAGGGGVLFDALAKRGVSCRKLEKLVHPIRPLQDLAAYFEIKATLRKMKPDLVTTHSNKAGLLGRLAAGSLKIPVTFTSHGFLFSEDEKSFRGHFYRLMEKIASRAASMVIAVSESEKKLAVKLQVIPEAKITVIHNGLSDISPQQKAIPSAEPPDLVMVARFADPKDHKTLLEALSRMIDKQWRLRLIGDGPLLAETKQLTARLGLEERVTFMGSRDDVTDLLAKEQIFVLASKREGFPLSILEAMRAGLPVVASKVGGTSEAVLDGECGYLFPAGDSEALLQRLLRLLEDPLLRQSMGKAGRDRYLANFTLDIMVDKTVSLFETLVQL